MEDNSDKFEGDKEKKHVHVLLVKFVEMVVLLGFVYIAGEYMFG